MFGKRDLVVVPGIFVVLHGVPEYCQPLVSGLRDDNRPFLLIRAGRFAMLGPDFDQRALVRNFIGVRE